MLEVMLLAEFDDQTLQHSEVMSWYSWEKMVLELELQTYMEPVQP